MSRFTLRDLFWLIFVTSSVLGVWIAWKNGDARLRAEFDRERQFFREQLRSKEKKYEDLRQLWLNAYGPLEPMRSHQNAERP